MIEQGTLAAIGVLVAIQLDPDEFLPFALLSIVVGLGVVLSSLGLHVEVLSRPTVRFATREFVTIATLWLVLFVVGVFASVVAGRWLGLSVAAGAVWIATALSGIGKATLLRDGRARHQAAFEAISAAGGWVTFGLSSIVLEPAGAGMAAVVAIFASEAVLTFRPRSTFIATGARRERSVIRSQAGAYINSNTDYMAAAALLGSGLSIYTLGFRLANAAHSQISGVIVRVFLADYANESAESARRDLYRSSTATIFSLSAIVSLAIVVPMIYINDLLSDDWDGFMEVVVAVAIGAPMRAVMGIGGAKLVLDSLSSKLVTFELIRLSISLPVLLLAATRGVATLAVAGSALTAVFSLLAHGLAQSWRRSDVSNVAAYGGIVTLVFLLVMGVVTS